MMADLDLDENEINIEVIPDDDQQDFKLSEDNNILDSCMNIDNPHDPDANTDSIDGYMSLMNISYSLPKEEIFDKALRLKELWLKTKKDLETQIKCVQELYKKNSELKEENAKLKQSNFQRNNNKDTDHGTKPANVETETAADDLEKIENTVQFSEIQGAETKLLNGEDKDEEVYSDAPEVHCKRCEELHKEIDDLKQQMELSERQLVKIENDTELTKAKDKLEIEIKEKQQELQKMKETVEADREEHEKIINQLKIENEALQNKSKNSSAINRPIQEEDWFHGVVPREDIIRLLKEDGDYLVRKSNNKKTGDVQYVLSVMWTDPKHFIILTQDNQWFLEANKFNSIQELIMDQHSSGRPVTLKSQAILKKPILRESWEALSESSCNELVKLREINDGLEKNNQEQQQEITSIRKQNEDDKEALRVSTELHEAEKKKLQEEVTAVTEEKEYLQQQVKTLHDEKDTFQCQIKTLDDQCKELQDKNTRSEQINTELQNESTVSSQALEEQVKTLTSTNTSLQTNVNEITEDKKALAVQLEAVHSDLTENYKRTDLLNSQINTLTEELKTKGSVEESITNQKLLLESENKDFQDQIVCLNIANEKLLETKSNVSEEKSAADEQIKKLKIDLKEAKDKLVTFQGSYEKEKHSNMDQRKSLQAQNTVLSDECNKSAIKLASINELLQQQKLEKEQEIKVLKEALEKAEGNVKDIKVSMDEEVKNQRGQVTSLVGELQEEKDRFESCNRICDKQKDKIHSLEDTLEDKEMKLQLQLRKVAQDDELLAHLQDHVTKEVTEKESVKEEYGKLIQKYHNLALQAKETDTQKCKFQEQVDNLTAQLMTAEESMDDRNTTINKLRQEKEDACTQNESLKNEMKMQSTRAEVYAQDFDAEREARTNAHVRVEQLEEFIKELENEIETLKKRIEELSKDSLNKMKQRHASQSNLYATLGGVDRLGNHSGDALGRNNIGGPMDQGHVVEGYRDDRRFPEDHPQAEEDPIYQCPVCQEEYPDHESLNMHVNDQCLK